MKFLLIVVVFSIACAISIAQQADPATAAQSADAKFMNKVRQNTDFIGRAILRRIDKVNKQLKKSLAGGISTQGETLRLMRESQPLRHSLIPRIRNMRLRATYTKLTENVQQLLDEKPRGEAGQAEINASLKRGEKILSS